MNKNNFLTNKYHFIEIAVFMVIIFLRLFNLAADPSILLDSGQVGDEGYWVYNARNLVTFGQTAKDDFYHDFAAAPLFSLITYLSFYLFGVGFWQARLVSGISGIITLFFVYLIASKFGKKIALTATFLVAINTLLLLHNRLAVGESLSVMFAVGGFYFLFQKVNEKVSGIFFALSVLSKTTSFLYLPSVFLILISNFQNRRINLKKLLNFIVIFSLTFIIVFGLFYLKWPQQISLIYNSFGLWYKPTTFTEIWQNIINFFIHPFWGSPFLFALLFLAIINGFNYIFIKSRRTNERKLLLLWLLGIVILGPLISRLSNARLLGLIVPIVILATQIIFDRELTQFKVRKLDMKLKLPKLLLFITKIIICIAPAIIVGKIALAIYKRMTSNPMIVYKLPIVSFFILFLIIFIAFKNKAILQKIWKLNIFFIMFLPFAAFIMLIPSFLIFFGFITSVQTSTISILTIISFVIFYFLLSNEINIQKAIIPLLFSYLLFNLIGLATIFYRPTYNIQKASSELGKIIGEDSFIGFYGHELAIGNKSFPIYWAPNLMYVGVVNADYEKYNPSYLLVTNVFDSIRASPTDWSSTYNINKKLQEITTLDLSRNFWRVKREVKITVYQIMD